MPTIVFRNFVTLIVIGGLIGGSGIAIIAESFTQPQILVTEITASDGTVTKTFTNNSLSNNQLFNIWIGAVISYAGSIIAVLYKAPKGSGEDS